MNILIIHGSPRKNGCSTNIAYNIANEFSSAKIVEINLHKQNLPYCVGCLNCVKKGIEYCPHSEKTIAFKRNMLEADLIIIASPVYILHMSGQLKTFIDHYPTMFLTHRPEKAMFNKQVVVIASAAGPVYKQTLKELKECFTYFGFSKIYKLGIAVKAENYYKLKEPTVVEIEKKVDKICKKINKNLDSNKISLKIRLWFHISRILQKKVSMSEIDHLYWTNNNWLKNSRPWK